MSKRYKLIERFKKRPRDFSSAELENLLYGYGYTILPSGNTGGSRIKFVHNVYPSIFLHKPHPSHILKKYRIDYIYEFLLNERLI